MKNYVSGLELDSVKWTGLKVIGFGKTGFFAWIHVAKILKERTRLTDWLNKYQNELAILDP